MSIEGSQLAMGSIIGLDDFFKDIEKTLSSEATLNPEHLIMELIEHSFEKRGEIVSLVMSEAYSKTQISIGFNFAIGTESLEELVIIYLGYQEEA
ncbi:hypothetical protein [Enterococcus gallinarum]|uniref:hypothetical protein n=1 Tax=Enterococcus gallinarum TaxID=1353 RepID=UPI0018AAE4DE|nr:hypothetical protein [Enterococcus gallinarum]